MRAFLSLLSIGVAALAGQIALVAARPPGPAELKQAVEEANQANQRSQAFEQQAARAGDDATRARAEAEALASRIQAAEANITAAQARVQVVDAMLRLQRARIATQQGPLIRLTAALQTMSLRPPALAIVQPGSLDDTVRIRAVLAATIPRVQARTAGLRGELDRTRELQGAVGEARERLVASRTDLANRRNALAAFATTQSERSRDLAGLALRESDRALAFGEEARRVEQQVRDRGFQEQLGRRLASLDGPVRRPEDDGSTSPRPPFAYRLPVNGRLVTGTGEVSEAGVHGRGLVLAVPADRAVIAPAPGRVLFAGPFRSFGTLVIIDHGNGWTTAVTDLAAIDTAVGQQVAAGQQIGRTAASDRLSVELRFNGQPVAIAGLLAG